MSTVADSEDRDEAPARLLAAYKLPIPVVADSDALGVQVRGSIGAAAVEIRVPVAQDDSPELDTDDFTLVNAKDDEALDLPETRRILRDWSEDPSTACPAERTSIDIKRLLVRVTGHAAEVGPARVGVGGDHDARLTDELFREMNHWHDIFRSWIEVVTMQDLDHVHPRWTAHIEGVGLATFQPDGQRLGRGGILRLDTHWPAPATKHLIANALVSACLHEYPPLAHQVLRDARAAYDRGHMRKAILDAATATEISLNALADRAGLLSGKPLMLGKLVAALDAGGHLPPGTALELFTLVVSPRNKAIHEGRVTLSGWDTAEACKAAQRAVWTAFPL